MWKVPRAANQTTDDLAKLSSTIVPWTLEKPIEQTLLVACIEWSVDLDL